MAQRYSYIVTQRDYDHYSENANVQMKIVGSHATLGIANANAHSIAQREAKCAINPSYGTVEVNFDHFGGYSAYCQTAEHHRDHFEIQVERRLEGAPRPTQLSGLPSWIHPQLLPGALSQPHQRYLPTPVDDQKLLPGPVHQQLLAPRQAHATYQFPVSQPRQHAYVIVQRDYDHWESDAKVKSSIIGIHLDLDIANEAAMRHAKRERGNVFRRNVVIQESINHTDGYVLECRTFEDHRDHFVIEVEEHDLGDTGCYEDCDGSEDDDEEIDETDGQDADGEEEADETESLCSTRPLKRQRR